MGRGLTRRHHKYVYECRCHFVGELLIPQQSYQPVLHLKLLALCEAKLCRYGHWKNTWKNSHCPIARTLAYRHRGFLRHQ